MSLEFQITFFILLFIQFAVLATYKDKLEDIPYIGKGLFVVFIVQDWIMNWIMTVWFLDPPAKWNAVVTDRMKRYLRDYGKKRITRKLNPLESWRYYFSYIVCRLLHMFDPGHCD